MRLGVGQTALSDDHVLILFDLLVLLLALGRLLSHHQINVLLVVLNCSFDVNFVFEVVLDLSLVLAGTHVVGPFGLVGLSMTSRLLLDIWKVVFQPKWRDELASLLVWGD